MTLHQMPARADRALPPRITPRAALELNATVVDRTDLTEAIMVLTVRPDQQLVFAAGQYASLGLLVDDRLVQRPYSPASSPANRDLELLIRRVSGGELTPRLFRAKRGDRVRVGRAKGVFRLDADDDRHHLLVATGTGVAPMVAMLGELLARSRPPAIAVVHGVAYRRELAFSDRLALLAAGASGPRYLPVVSRPRHPENGGWSGREGRLPDLLPTLLREIGCAPTRTVAYLCGNPAVIAALCAGLERQGLPREAIRREEYWSVD